MLIERGFWRPVAARAAIEDQRKIASAKKEQFKHAAPS
jgi:hypothetical protein